MESWEDLSEWRDQLNQESNFITKLLAQIDEQINCLQVEQMELANAMREKYAKSPIEQKPQTHQTTVKTLDLTPVITKNDIEEEEEEDEEQS